MYRWWCLLASLILLTPIAPGAQVDKAGPIDDDPPVTGVTSDPRAPAALVVEAECSTAAVGASRATFIWRSPPSEVRTLRLDVTMFRDGFAKERFEAVGQIPAAQERLVWDGGRGGVNYYWRVLALTPDGWIASDTARYEAPICPVDFVEPPPPR